MKRVLQLCVVLVARRSAFLPHRVRPKPRAGLSGSVSRALMRTRGQATTLVSPSGDALRKTKTSSKMPRKVDCFYVCPTVSGQATPNANRDIDPELNSIALYQAARFSQTCRVFTPRVPPDHCREPFPGPSSARERTPPAKGMRFSASRSKTAAWGRTRSQAGWSRQLHGSRAARSVAAPCRCPRKRQPPGPHRAPYWRRALTGRLRLKSVQPRAQPAEPRRQEGARELRWGPIATSAVIWSVVDEGCELHGAPPAQRQSPRRPVPQISAWVYIRLTIVRRRWESLTSHGSAVRRINGGTPGAQAR